MIQVQRADLHVVRHFTVLVYPFRHALVGKERVTRLHRLEKIWQPWWRRLDHNALQSALDDSYFFLPYIRELLFPETALLPEADAPEQLAEAGSLARLPTGALASRIPVDAVLRLTYNLERLQTLGSFQLEFAREDFAVPFDLCWVDVVLFPQRVGLLLLKVQVREEAPTVGRVNDFLYYLRLVHPPTIGWELASWRCPRLVPSISFTSRDVVDFLLQGLTEVSAPLVQTFEAWVAHSSKTAPAQRYTASQSGQVYGQVFNLYTYACLANSSAPGAEHPGQEEQGFTASAVGPGNDRQALFPSPVQRVLYELATCTDTNNPTYVPHPSYLASLLERGLVAFWDNWQGMALHDNVVFLGARESRFTLETLAHNVESDYFHLYLFTLFQKMWLSMTFGELIRRQANLSRNLREARRLWDAFMMFENHYWFSEVTRKPQGTELYRRFQRGLDVVPLHEEMSQEMGRLQGYYEGKVERRISSLLNLLAFVGLPAGLLAELFSNVLTQNASLRHFVLTATVMYAVFGGLWLLWRYTRRE